MRVIYRLLLLALFPVCFAHAAIPPQSEESLQRAEQIVRGVVTAIEWQQEAHPVDTRCTVRNLATLTIETPDGRVVASGYTISRKCQSGWVGPAGHEGLDTVKVGSKVTVYSNSPKGAPVLEILEPNGLLIAPEK